MLTFSIRPEPPYDFNKMLRRLKNVKHEVFRLNAGVLRLTIRAGMNVYLLEIHSLGTIENPLLEARILGDSTPSTNEAAQLLDLIERMVSSRTDLKPFHRHMKELGPEMDALAERFRGMHLLVEADLFECMCKTIIGQQLNLSFASELTRRLMSAAARPLVVEGEEYPVFPSPQEVARLEFEQLQALQFSRRKAEYVIDWARCVTAGTVDLARLNGLNNAQILEELTVLRGIGRWTVECFLLFGLGRADLLPAADIGLRNALKKLYSLPQQPNEAEVRLMGAGWSPWSSYVTFYLWESLNDKENCELK